MAPVKNKSASKTKNPPDEQTVKATAAKKAAAPKKPAAKKKAPAKKKAAVKTAEA